MGHARIRSGGKCLQGRETTFELRGSAGRSRARPPPSCASPPPQAAAPRPRQPRVPPAGRRPPPDGSVGPRGSGRAAAPAGLRPYLSGGEGGGSRPGGRGSGRGEPRGPPPAGSAARPAPGAPGSGAAIGGGDVLAGRHGGERPRRCRAEAALAPAAEEGEATGSGGKRRPGGTERLPRHTCEGGGGGGGGRPPAPRCDGEAARGGRGPSGALRLLRQAGRRSGAGPAGARARDPRPRRDPAGPGAVGPRRAGPAPGAPHPEPLRLRPRGAARPRHGPGPPAPRRAAGPAAHRRTGLTRESAPGKSLTELTHPSGHREFMDVPWRNRG